MAGATRRAQQSRGSGVSAASSAGPPRPPAPAGAAGRGRGARTPARLPRWGTRAVSGPSPCPQPAAWTGSRAGLGGARARNPARGRSRAGRSGRGGRGWWGGEADRGPSHWAPPWAHPSGWWCCSSGGHHIGGGDGARRLRLGVHGSVAGRGGCGGRGWWGGEAGRGACHWGAPSWAHRSGWGCLPSGGRPTGGGDGAWLPRLGGHGTVAGRSGE